MDQQDLILQDDVQNLRTKFYNASVVSIQLCHEDLMILRIRPDHGVPTFHPGQYLALGLGYWEPRASNCQPEGDITQLRSKLIKRAYSISCPLLSPEGQLVGVNDVDFMEFYITLVRQSPAHPPALTPRIFSLAPGDRLYCDPHIHGHYTLEPVVPLSQFVFAATGTGEAPHNAMVADLLKSNRQTKIVNITCVRWKTDLGYLAIHRRLEELYPNYHYIALTTREPENLDPKHPNYLGKRYLQEYIESGGLALETGLQLNPENTHVFLCGNPDMIGVPLRTHDPSKRYPTPNGMVETLEKMGFHIDQPHHRGNIHFEKYW